MAVKRLKNGTFQLDYRPIPGGDRVRIGGFLSAKAALTYALETKQIIRSKIAGISSDVSFADAADKYLELMTPSKSQSLHTVERGWFLKLERYLKFERKKTLLWQIELSDLEHYQRALKAHRKASTINRRFHTYGHFFNKCVDWGLLKASPQQRLKALPEAQNRRRLWTAQEILLVQKNLPSAYQEVFRLIAETGARPIEIFRLKKKDVDLKKQVVIFGSRKGGQGEQLREVPLSPVAHNILKKNVLRVQGSFVFPSTKTGESFDRCTLQKNVKKVCEELKLDGLTVYGLRHTFISELLDQDVAINKVMDLAGHKKITTTQGYAQSKRKSLRQAMLKNNIERRARDT